MVFLASAASVRPAFAQVSGSLDVASDDRWRGRSLSDGRPVVSLTTAFDAPDGFYVDGVATAGSDRDAGVVIIGGAIDAGYAVRTGRALTIDIGATRQQFTRHFSGGRAAGYSEIYAGISGHSLSARLSYSPDYFMPGVRALYASLDGVLRPATSLRLTAHAGAIAYASPINGTGLRPIEYDASVGAMRRFKMVDVRVEFVFGGPDPDYYRGRSHRKTALVGGAAIAF